jgi:hypothetical protein
MNSNRQLFTRLRRAHALWNPEVGLVITNAHLAGEKVIGAKVFVLVDVHIEIPDVE